MVQSYYKSSNNDFILAHGDCFKLLKEFDFKFDMIFADPLTFSLTVEYRCRTVRSSALIKGIGTKVNRKWT